MAFLSRFSSRHFATLLIAFALLASACSSGGTDALDTTPPTIDIDGPVDPEVVRQLATGILQTDVSGEPLTCLVDDSEGDTQLTAIYNGPNNQQLTPEGLTALTGSLFGCFETATLATSLVALSGATDALQISDFTSCAADQISAVPNGDLAFTGMVAIQLQQSVPEGAQEPTLEAVTTCVPVSSIINVFADQQEQLSGFTEQVDRSCAVDLADDETVTGFWEGLITGSGTEGTLDTVVQECTSGGSDLPTEIPASFVPWSGEGTLAGVAPASRINAYSEQPPNLLVDGVDYQAVVTTGDGAITIDLFEENAPITVNTFVALARDGYYDGTTFHRVLDGFMAQGGDPTATGSGGPGFNFDDEPAALTSIDRRGLLAMANAGPNTNGSQFFITFEPATFLDGLHAVFGEVIDGDDVLSQIDLRDPAAPTTRGESLVSVEILEL